VHTRENPRKIVCKGKFSAGSKPKITYFIGGKDLITLKNIIKIRVSPPFMNPPPFHQVQNQKWETKSKNYLV
jgi:hypothetical protein